MVSKWARARALLSCYSLRALPYGISSVSGRLGRMCVNTSAGSLFLILKKIASVLKSIPSSGANTPTFPLKTQAVVLIASLQVISAGVDLLYSTYR